MWVKDLTKNIDTISILELEEKNKKKLKSINNFYLIKVVKYFLILFSFISIIYKIAGNSSGRNFATPSKITPLSWHEFFTFLPFFGLISLIIAIYGSKFIKDNYKYPYVCENCQRIKEFDNKFNCKCGGTFYSIDEMKWVDNLKP